MALAFQGTHVSYYRGKRGMDENPDLGLFLKSVRGERRLTQEQVAQAIKVSLAHYRRMEAGRVPNPGPQLIGALSQVLGRPVGDFYVAAGWIKFDTAQLWEQLPPDDQTLVLELVKRLVRVENKPVAVVGSAV